MKATRLVSASLLVLFAAVSTSYLLPPVHAQGISVSRPQIVGGGFIVTQTGIVEVEVNVTSTYRIANVTLYYLANDTAPLIPSLYTPLPMQFGWGEDFNAIYVVTMPYVRNDTVVWGFVVAFDDHGNRGGSVYDRLQIYQALTPNPNDTELDLDFRIRHINPKTMTVNASVEATLTNYADYKAAQINVEGTDRPSLDISQNNGLFYYSSGTQFYTLYYWQGVPELYPLDSYNFTYALWLPTYLNDSGRVAILTLNGKTHLRPGAIFEDFYGKERYLTLQEKQDNAAWDVHTFVQFYPSRNFTASWPILRITVVLTRQPQQVDFLLLVPVVSLYTLLGFSVLLRGPKELANRLLLYLTVFLFAYGFQSSVTALPMTPIVSGFSMIELLGLALIPITVILAVFSITIKAFIKNPDDLSDRSGLVAFASSIGLDTVAIAFSEISLYVIARVSVTYPFGIPSYGTYTYTLADLNGWGYATAILLSLGLVIRLVQATFRIYRA